MSINEHIKPWRLPSSLDEYDRIFKHGKYKQKMNENEQLDGPSMVLHGNYNFINQEERLIYLGHNFSGNGYWHQFALDDGKGKVWCELLTSDLHLIEATK